MRAPRTGRSVTEDERRSIGFLRDRCVGESHCGANFLFDLARDTRVLLEKRLRVLASLTETLAAERKPRSAFFHDVSLSGLIDQVAFARDAFAVHDVEFGLAEGWGDFVLDHLHARAAADDGLAVFDRADAPDVDADRRVELQRATAGGGFRIAEHHADLLAQLIDENQARLRLRDDARELAQRLRHQSRL